MALCSKLTILLIEKPSSQAIGKNNGETHQLQDDDDDADYHTYTVRVHVTFSGDLIDGSF